MAVPSYVLVPRPSSSRITRLLLVASLRISDASCTVTNKGTVILNNQWQKNTLDQEISPTINSTMKVLFPVWILSRAPILDHQTISTKIAFTVNVGHIIATCTLYRLHQEPPLLLRWLGQRSQSEPWCRSRQPAWCSNSSLPYWDPLLS